MEKNNKLRSILLLGIISSPFLLATNVNADSNGYSSLKVKSESGGMSILVDDVNYGDVVIGQNIPSKKGLIHITDRTGGKGWQLSVQSVNYEDVKDSMNYKITTDTVENINISDSSSLVLNGKSGLDTQDFEATYSSEWGNTPKSGELNNNLIWTVIPEMKTMAEELKDTVTFGHRNMLTPTLTYIYKLDEDDEDFVDIEKKFNESPYFIDLEGFYGKIDDNNNLNMYLDLEYFDPLDTVEYGKSIGKKEHRSIWEYSFTSKGLPVPEVSDEDVEWVVQDDMATELYSNVFDLSLDKNIIQDELSHTTDEDGYYYATSSMFTPVNFHTTINLFPNLSQRIKLRFIDGSELKFTYNFSYLSEPNFRY